VKEKKKKDKDKKKAKKRERSSSSDSDKNSSSSGKKKKKKKEKKEAKKAKVEKRSPVPENPDDSEAAARAQAALRAAAAAAAVAGARRRSASPLAGENAEWGDRGSKEVAQAPKANKGWDPPEETEADQDLENRDRGFMRPEKIEILQLPKAVIGRVIGKAGATIKDIRERTGARIDARDQTEDPVQVLLSGSVESCEHAKALILEVADGAVISSGDADSRETSREVAAAAAIAAAAAVAARAASGRVAGDDNGPTVEEHMELPRHATGKVIGTKGAQIAEIRAKAGAQVDVDKSATGCSIRLVGDREQVDVAKAMINAIMEPLPEGANGGEYLEIPKSAVGRVIGAGGSRIQELQERSGAKIDIDRQPDRVLVRFAGFPENIQTAKMLVTEVLEGRDRTSLAEAAATMEIPPSTTGRLIGPGGRQINEIQERSGAKIDLDKGRDPCIVRMTGTADAVAVAQVMVREVLSQHPGGGLVGSSTRGPPGQGTQDAALQASLKRAAAAAHAARAQLATSAGQAPMPGGCAPQSSAGQDEESITFDVPLHLVDKVLGDGSWQKSVEQKTGARVIVRRDSTRCQLELIGQPEQVVDAESLAEETVRVLAAGTPAPPPPAVPQAPAVPSQAFRPPPVPPAAPTAPTAGAMALPPVPPVPGVIGTMPGMATGTTALLRPPGPGSLPAPPWAGRPPMPPPPFPGGLGAPPPLLGAPGLLMPTAPGRPLMQAPPLLTMPHGTAPLGFALPPPPGLAFGSSTLPFRPPGLRPP